MASKKQVGSKKSDQQRSHSPMNSSSRHFFKIIFSDTLEEKKLRIPLKFARKFGDELSDVASLIVPNGRAWQVELTKSNNQIWFESGWHEFVEQHSIGPRYLVVFSYKGSSNFSVIIFDTTACEIQYPCNGSNPCRGPSNGKRRSVDHKDKMEGEGPMEIPGASIPSKCTYALRSRVCDAITSKGNSNGRHNNIEQNPATNKHPWNVASLKVQDEAESGNETRSKRCRIEKQDKHGMSSKPKHFNNETNYNSTCKTIPGGNQSLPKCEEDTEMVTSEIFTSGLKKASPGSERAIQAARMFKPKNPSFMVVFRPYNFYNNMVRVPGEFAKKYLNRISKYVKLQVSDGRHWTVRVNYNQAGCPQFGRGLNEFFRENNLEKGDVCIFELMNVGLKVSIFRAAHDIVPVN